MHPAGLDLKLYSLSPNLQLNLRYITNATYTYIALNGYFPWVTPSLVCLYSVVLCCYNYVSTTQRDWMTMPACMSYYDCMDSMHSHPIALQYVAILHMSLH